ncbi:MAG: 5'-methylthioadenosine/adenosylhomocysteine nucleosidase [Sulfuricurvum sp.]
MKIAILGAMSEEIEPILEAVGEYKTTRYADNNYYEASYKGLDLVIAYSKIGKVFSSLSAAVLIEHFGCEKLLFSGVAGAITPTLKIGDIVIASKLAQHDLDITVFGHPYGYVPEGSVFVEADRELNLLAHSIAKDLGIEVVEGVIATGDQFVADETRRSFIERTFKADALEMEGASVAVVCHSLGVPFFILRSISDAADMEAGFSFDEFLKSSAEVSAKFVLAMVDRLGR